MFYFSRNASNILYCLNGSSCISNKLFQKCIRPRWILCDLGKTIFIILSLLKISVILRTSFIVLWSKENNECNWVWFPGLGYKKDFSLCLGLQISYHGSSQQSCHGDVHEAQWSDPQDKKKLVNNGEKKKKNNLEISLLKTVAPANIWLQSHERGYHSCPTISPLSYCPTKSVT